MLILLYILPCFLIWNNVDAKLPNRVIASLVSYDFLCNHHTTKNLDISKLRVFFYDFQANFNISHPIIGAVDGITSQYELDFTRRLIFFVPGDEYHTSKNQTEIIKQTFKDVPNTYLIIIDHSAYTSEEESTLKSYERAVTYTYYIGKALGEFLTDLHNYGYPSKNIRCIGHSLGAQMLGYTGTTYLNRTLEKISRITGLDPVGLCFSDDIDQDHIRSGVAEYVEVYHCNSEGLGSTAVLADADFFLYYKIVSGSTTDTMPVKVESDDTKYTHKACVRYWALTVHNPHWYTAWSCDSYDKFRQGKCATNENAIAGYFNTGNSTGVFYTSMESYGIK